MIYRFDRCRLDTNTHEIALAGERLSIEPQVFDLLRLLIANRERTVSKDEILATIWKDRIVSDAALSSRIKSARRSIGDDGKSQRLIRTIHGRGFRFVGDVIEEATEGTVDDNSVDAALSPSPSHPPITRYAKSGDVHIAYQVFGSGPVNLVMVPGFISHIDHYWDSPTFGRWLSKLAGFARVAVFDKRGTGLSDSVSDLPDLDVRMDDVRAVMDAAGFESAVIMGSSEGGSLASLFAATHPERCLGLILYGAFAHFSAWVATPADLQRLIGYIEQQWGSGNSIPGFAPSAADDPAMKQWWGKFERSSATPGAAIALLRMNSEIDIADILPSIRVPTLVIHRRDDALIDVEGGRFLARSIPGAKYVEVPGRDHMICVGEGADQILQNVKAFLTRHFDDVTPDSVLATVLAVSIAPAYLSDARDTLMIAETVASFRGTHFVQDQAHLLARFDGPRRALQCAEHLVGRLRERGIIARFGLHTGEINAQGAAVRGVARDIAGFLADRAALGEILVSRTVKDLVAGAGLSFEDAGKQQPPGADRPWRLHRLRTLLAA